ncbi:MAG: hypothetical protein ACI9VS_003825 [Candidatus Binatia bacterium]|jgi:hypothetical protein
MTEHALFHLFLLSQILVISFYYPNRLLGRLNHVFETYPPATHPRLYPKPIESYRTSHRNYMIANRIIILAGFFLLAGLIITPRSGDWDKAILTWFFMLQIVPLFLLDLGALREFKLMRNANPNATRRAELRPRHLFDFVSPAYLGVAIATYIAFAAFIIFVNQFEFPWFGGYQNVVGITAMNLFFAGIVLWNMYGKKPNPLQANEDRMRQIEMSVKVLMFTSIAATIFISLSIVLSAFELNHLQAIVQAVYFQILAVASFQCYLQPSTNFEVYKDDPALA